MSVSHWGEFPTKSNTNDIPDVSLDIENAMNLHCLAELSDKDEEFAEKSEQIDLSPIDPFMFYAISLHKYANQKLDISNYENATIEIPKRPDICMRHKNNNLNYVAKEFTNFTTGVEIDIPELSTTIIKQILVKCVAAMLAHISFETSEQRALDVLADALEEFFKKISKHYKIALEDDRKGHKSNFPYPIERVLTEIGLGGINGLKDYYNCRILKYISVLEKRYRNLSISQPHSPIDNKNKVVKVKVEQDDEVQVKNAEVHFCTIEGDVNPSILETGYQLLNSLEANTQNLNQVNDQVNISECLSSDSEISQLSPYSKKKKYK